MSVVLDAGFADISENLNNNCHINFNLVVNVLPLMSQTEDLNFLNAA